MTCEVAVFHPLDGPFSRVADLFTRHPNLWLPKTRAHGPNWLVTVDVDGHSRTVECTLGEPWRVGDTVWRHLSWSVPDKRWADGLVPDVDAEIGLHRIDADHAAIVFHGHCDHSSVEAVSNEHSVRAIVMRFLADVAASLHTQLGDVPQPVR